MKQATRGYPILLGVWLVVVLCWAVVRPGVGPGMGPGVGGVDARSTGQRIDVNQADAPALQLLPGVGPSIAKNIVASREAIGAFSGPKELERVRYIGPRLVARVGPWVDFGEVSLDDSLGAGPGPR